MRFNQQIKTTGALALALSAIAATTPAATAHAASANRVVRPNPDQQALTSQPKPAEPRPAASPTVRPNPDEQTPAPSTGPHSEVIDNGGYGPANPSPTIVRVVGPSSGFDWGDAAIGAAGALGLACLGLGSALAISHRRARRTRRAAA